MATDLSEKETRLRQLIAGYLTGPAEKLLVAFSGGVDSSLLLWESVQAVGPGKLTAVTATAPTSVPGEEHSAIEFARSLGVEHLIVPTLECDDPEFTANTPNRCYVCKRIRYAALRSIRDHVVILDGTQADDDPTDRPGMRAVHELNVKTPLREADLGKVEIRALLVAAGFHVLAEKQPQPCLATRIPEGTPVTGEALELVGKGEALLRRWGLRTVRLRHHGAFARIETDEAGMTLVLSDKKIRAAMHRGLRELGYRYVALDLEEYGHKPATEETPV